MSAFCFRYKPLHLFFAMRQIIRNMELLFGVEMSKSYFCVATWVFANKKLTNDLLSNWKVSFRVDFFFLFIRSINIYLFAVSCSCFMVCNSFKDNRRLTYYNSMIVQQIQITFGRPEKRNSSSRVVMTITGTTKYMCIRITVVRAIFIYSVLSGCVHVTVQHVSSKKWRRSANVRREQSRRFKFKPSKYY